MSRRYTWYFAIAFIIVGFLGFIPFLAPNGYLFGVFEVDIFHNIIHLATGVVFLWSAVSPENTGKLVFKIVGIAYAIVAIVGLVQGNTVLGLISTNFADHILHVALAGTILYFGFSKDKGHI